MLDVGTGAGRANCSEMRRLFHLETCCGDPTGPSGILPDLKSCVCDAPAATPETGEPVVWCELGAGLVFSYQAKQKAPLKTRQEKAAGDSDEGRPVSTEWSERKRD